MKSLHPNAKKQSEQGSAETWRLQKNRKGVLAATLDSGRVAALANATDC